MEQVCTEQDTAKIQARAKQKIAHVEKNLKLQMPRAYKSDGAAIKSSEWHVLTTSKACCASARHYIVTTNNSVLNIGGCDAVGDGAIDYVYQNINRGIQSFVNMKNICLDT